MGWDPLPGDIGCYFSHLGVWRELVDSDYPAGLVLEDDVVFHDEFPLAVEVALSASDDWDVVRFCAVRSKLPKTRRVLHPFRLNSYVGPFTGNAAYMVTTSAAERLLPGLGTMSRTHDHELNRFDVHDYRLTGTGAVFLSPGRRGKEHDHGGALRSRSKAAMAPATAVLPSKGRKLLATLAVVGAKRLMELPERSD